MNDENSEEYMVSNQELDTNLTPDSKEFMSDYSEFILEEFERMKFKNFMIFGRFFDQNEAVLLHKIEHRYKSLKFLLDDDKNKT